MHKTADFAEDAEKKEKIFCLICKICGYFCNFAPDLELDLWCIIFLRALVSR